MPRRSVTSSRDAAQPPNAAQSATIPRIRILVAPQPACIQAQPEVDGNTARAKAAHQGLAIQALGADRFRGCFKSKIRDWMAPMERFSS
jgi:hypothetical protein